MSGETLPDATVKIIPSFGVFRSDTEVSHEDISASDTYPIKNKKRGIALIFNNFKFIKNTLLPSRKGIVDDCVRLHTVFTDLKFNVIFKENQTAEQMRNEVKLMSEKNHSNYDCFIMCILSHGLGNEIYCTDGGTITLDELSDPFKGDNCTSLVTKPKVFIVQVCHVSKLEPPLELVVPEPVNETLEAIDGVIETEDAEPKKAVTYGRTSVQADFIFAHSCLPGTCTWNQSQIGSWYINALCEEIENNSSSKDILQIFTSINGKAYKVIESSNNTKHICKMPYLNTTLTKDFYFKD